MSVLGGVVVLASAAYVLPKVLSVGFAFGLTELGKFMVTWTTFAVLYDIIINPEYEDAFNYGDAAITGVMAFAARLAARRMGG